jgi:hypothetical protein
MKKLLVLIALFTTVYVTKADAQQGGGGQGGDPAQMLQRYKDRVKPQLIEKTKLTDAQAEKVLDINFNYRTKMRGLRDLSEDDRKKQMDEITASQNKDYAAIPLTEDQVKAVNQFFDDLRKQMQQQRQNGGGNGGNGN